RPGLRAALAVRGEEQLEGCGPARLVQYRRQQPLAGCLGDTAQGFLVAAPAGLVQGPGDLLLVGTRGRFLA
ncbi:hypothetical protein, partial [Pantoea sp. GbtcB22]|uniref:hypothetical protein n=1 Tax=Pantoea sp. GbtcB22 TaxID=2824767 RepID=UPI001C2FDAC8